MNSHQSGPGEPKDYLTVLSVPQEVAAPNKYVHIDKDGRPRKVAVAPALVAVAYTVRVSDVYALEELLRQTADATHQVLVQGYWPESEPPEGEPRGEEFLVASRGKLEELTGGPYTGGWTEIEVDGTTARATARLKQNMAPSSWIQLDRDYADGIPEHLGSLTDDEWVATMDTILPGFADAGRVRVASTSGRVLVDGVPIDATGCRYWFQIQDPTDQGLGPKLVAQAAANGLGFRKVNKAGAGTLWTIFDPTVFSYERLVFDGKPTLGTRGHSKGRLSLRDPDIQVFEGGRVDTHQVPMLQAAQRGRVQREFNVQVSRTGTGLKMRNDTLLTLDTEVEVKRSGRSEVLTVRDFMASGDDKWRCQATFRESDSWNGMLVTDYRGLPRLYDNGTHTWYELAQESRVELASKRFGARDNGQ